MGLFYAGFAMARAGAPAAEPHRRALADAGAAAVAELAQARGGRARGRQPDPGAAPHVGHGDGPHALARARHHAGRHREGQLRLDHGVDDDGAEPGPVRDGVAEPDGAQLQVPACARRRTGDDRRRRRGSARAQPPDRLQGHARDARGRGGEVDGRPRQAAPGRRPARDVRARRRRQGRDPLGQLRRRCRACTTATRSSWRRPPASIACRLSAWWWTGRISRAPS